MRLAIFFLIAPFLATSTTASAASFDCTKAKSLVEQKICTDPLLGRLDETLAVNYRSMLDSDFGNTQKSLRDEQEKWLAGRNRCKTTECLVQDYRKRIDDTCAYGVVSGVHPECTMSEDIH